MAISFANISIHTRAKGHSAVAGAAYRAGSKMTDERTGLEYDFTKRKDVVYSSLMLPNNAPDIFNDAEVLWNQVEKSEKRKDAQVAKDVVLALPKELSSTEHISLARQFVYNHFVKNGLAVDIAIHDHGDGNPHAHLYVTTRRVIAEGFDRYKARDLNPAFSNGVGRSGFISETDAWGELWRDEQNSFFVENGLELEVDPNYLVSQRHEGRIRSELHYLKEENALRKAASVEIALTSPESVLNVLSSKKAVFSEKDISRLLRKNTNTENEYQQALVNVKAYHGLVLLGPGEDGRIRYTTQANYELESSLGDLADGLHSKLMTRPFQSSSPERLNKLIVNFGLNSEQADALLHMTEGRGIAALVGRAGTGKTYLMKAAHEAWKDEGLEVVGMSVSGVAAKGLESGSGIPSKTIAYYNKRLAHNNWSLSANTVVVMDEAGMTDLNDMFNVVRHVSQAGARLVLVGDHDQLQPVGLGAAFRTLVERIGFAEMNRVMRQNDPLDCEATLELSKGNIEAALTHYDNKGQVHLLAKTEDAMGKLVQDWQTSFSQCSSSRQLIMAHRNVDVCDLNHLAREALIREGVLPKKETSFITSHGSQSFVEGERIVFLKNDKILGVCNGSFATLLCINGNKITAKVDGEKKPISFSIKDYNDFTYGYAATIHKSQGATIEDTFVYVGGRSWSRFLTYVALSRHRNCVNVYGAKREYADINQLSKMLGRNSLKDSVLDFAFSFAIRRGFDPDAMLGRWLDKLGDIRTKVHDAWLFVSQYESYAHLVVRRDKTNMTQQRRHEAVRVAQFVDTNRVLKSQWKSVHKDLMMGCVTQAELNQRPEYKTLLRQTHENNQLASGFLKNPKLVQQALELNCTPWSIIVQQAKIFETEVRVQSVMQAYKSHQHQKLRQLAPCVLNDIQGNYPTLMRHLETKSKTSALLNTLKAEQKTHDYYRLLKTTSTAPEKAHIKLRQHYLNEQSALKATWKTIYSNNAKDILSKSQWQQLNQRASYLNKLAATLCEFEKENPERFDELCIDLPLNKQELKAKARRYAQSITSNKKMDIIESREQKKSNKKATEITNKPHLLKAAPSESQGKASAIKTENSISSISPPKNLLKQAHSYEITQHKITKGAVTESSDLINVNHNQTSKSSDKIEIQKDLIRAAVDQVLSENEHKLKALREAYINPEDELVAEWFNLVKLRKDTQDPRKKDECNASINKLALKMYNNKSIRLSLKSNRPSLFELIKDRVPQANKSKTLGQDMDIDL